MKFIKLLTKHTGLEIRCILEKFTDSDKEYISSVYDEFDYVEFSDKDEIVGMFIIIGDEWLRKLTNFFFEKSINFSCVDLTKDVLFGNTIDIEGYKVLLPDEKEELSIELSHMVDVFYEENTSVDTILDKINEKGIESLNDVDKKILK